MYNIFKGNKNIEMNIYSDKTPVLAHLCYLVTFYEDDLLPFLLRSLNIIRQQAAAGFEPLSARRCIASLKSSLSLAMDRVTSG
jgi:hypothetical protein